ncbi:MAG TPA: HD domain-containing phosphohydrolase [Candidatus Paceibacterota bacterium]|nr:HD domain-containing phosphohydrolase [Candidatus Paceibacterota bacterium]
MNEPTPTPLAPQELPRILVVDDEEIILVALYETLRREQYEVITTSDPDVALDEMRKKEFSVIISDQRMPKMMGLDLLAQARQIQPMASRILITAVLSLDTVIEAINKGEIYRFIVKPWLREELLVTIKNAVQRFELTRQNSRLNAATQSMNEQLVELNRSLEQQVKLVAHQNEKLTEMNNALEENLLRSMELSLQLMQTFYPTLGNQAHRVAQLCHSLAQAANLPAEDRRVLNGAALLHDIGLVGVPRTIIRRWQNNPNSLDAAENALIRQHPILSQELTAFGNGTDQIGKVIRAHHEHFDGNGYPDGLAGEEIPWLARLLAVAVAFESSHLNRSDAVEEIKVKAGSVFDPEAVRALLKAIPLAPLPRKEKEIMLSDLRPGMVLARGIYTANGLLLVPEGQQLNSTYIEKLLNHNRVQPITQSLVVYC